MDRIRPWQLLPGILLCVWLAACNAPPAAPEPTLEQPVTVAPQGAITPALSAQAAPKATSAPLLAQIRESVLPATATPAATATPVIALPTPLPSPTPCAEPGRIVESSFQPALGPALSYRVYLPPCYEQSQLTYPVLYMLPGNIYTDSIWDDLGLDEAAERGIRAGEYDPFLIVMVSGGALADNTSGGPGSYETLFVEEFLPYVEQTYCAWPVRRGRAIGGMSRGGYWALEIAFRHPQKFASVGGHSAALLDAYGGPDVNPEQTGLNNDLSGLRIYFDIGQNDWVIANVQRLHESMTAAGIEHQWQLNEGRHEEAYWSAHVADYLAFYAAPWRMKEYPGCRPLPAASGS